MKKLFIFAICLFVFVIPALASSQLDEANTQFTFNGKPIHPFLVQELSNWISDNRPPMITTVDVAAAFNSNKYQQSIIKKQDGWWHAEKEELDQGIRLYESFDYRWLGTMKDSIHVLETGSSGGGSGFFMDLMFVKFSEGEIVWESKKTKQLLMTIVGTYSLGDRYEGDIKVFPDKVIISASKRQAGGGSAEKEVTLDFPMSSNE
jgi:hypothetical protein